MCAYGCFRMRMQAVVIIVSQSVNRQHSLISPVFDLSVDSLPCADSIGHGGHVPHFYKWLDRGAPSTVSRRTANMKLTKLY